MFHIASPKDIKECKTADVYFKRAIDILHARKIKRYAKAEVYLKGFPHNWDWGILAGIEEVIELFKDVPITVYSMPEGTLFRSYEPVLVIEGYYDAFAMYETAMLGFLCQASGIATKTARCKRKIGLNKSLFSFGARRMHPAISPMIERSAFIGGCDGVSSIKSGDILEIDPMGTMPHALILIIGDTVEAVKAFNEIIEKKVKRVALIDTFNDEKFEAIRVAEHFGNKLFAIRMDTPASRKGNFYEILREVRWELDIRGFNHIKIIVSGGIDEDEIEKINDVVDAYGIGTAISNAPVIDFSFDIVEIEGVPVAKRGKMSGAKKVYRCTSCPKRTVLPFNSPAPRCEGCNKEMELLICTMIENGKLTSPIPSPHDIKRYVIKQISHIAKET